LTFEHACFAGFEDLERGRQDAVPFAGSRELERRIVDSFVGELEAAEMRAD
jgi:hypothetical protein